MRILRLILRPTRQRDSLPSAWSVAHRVSRRKTCTALFLYPPAGGSTMNERHGYGRADYRRSTARTSVDLVERYLGRSFRRARVNRFIGCLRPLAPLAYAFSPYPALSPLLQSPDAASAASAHVAFVLFVWKERNFWNSSDFSGRGLRRLSVFLGRRCGR